MPSAAHSLDLSTAAVHSLSRKSRLLKRAMPYQRTSEFQKLIDDHYPFTLALERRGYSRRKIELMTIGPGYHPITAPQRCSRYIKDLLALRCGLWVLGFIIRRSINMAANVRGRFFNLCSCRTKRTETSYSQGF